MCTLASKISAIFRSYNLFVNNFGDIWWFLGKKKKSLFLFCENVFLYFMYTFVFLFVMLRFYMFFSLAHSTHKAQDILYFCSFRGILKAFSSFIWKNSLFFCCLIFWNINDDDTESKKLFYAWFSSSLCRCLLIFCASFLSMCTSSSFFFFFERKNFRLMYTEPKAPGAYTLLNLTQEKNLNKWFLIYVLRVLN
jgi:hypothetical protein